MNERIDYLLTALDYHLTCGDEPIEAWHEALEDYAHVYHTAGESASLQRAARRVLYHIGRENKENKEEIEP